MGVAKGKRGSAVLLNGFSGGIDKFYEEMRKGTLRIAGLGPEFGELVLEKEERKKGEVSAEQAVTLILNWGLYWL